MAVIKLVTQITTLTTPDSPVSERLIQQVAWSSRYEWIAKRLEEEIIRRKQSERREAITLYISICVIAALVVCLIRNGQG